MTRYMLTGAGQWTPCDGETWGADYAREVAEAAGRSFTPFVYRTPDALPEPGRPGGPGAPDLVRHLGALIDALDTARRWNLPRVVYDALARCPAGQRGRLLDALAVTHSADAALLRAQLARLGGG